MPIKKHNKSKLQKGSGIGKTIKGLFTPFYKKGSAKLEQVHTPNNERLPKRFKTLRESGAKSPMEVRARVKEKLRNKNNEKREVEELSKLGSTAQIVYKERISNIGRSSSFKKKVRNPHEEIAVVVVKENGEKETVYMSAKEAKKYAEKKADERRKAEEYAKAKEIKRSSKNKKRKTRTTGRKSKVAPEQEPNKPNNNDFGNSGN